MKKIFPRITTRGFYDLYSGKTIENESYRLYPKRDFETLIGSKEITIMIHGLRNNASGALTKFVIAKSRLAKLGYKNPVVGYSYDSNTVGVQYISHALHALYTAVTIANKNGRNLARFVTDFKHRSPDTKIRLMGHSLGAHVIQSAVKNLAKFVVFVTTILKYITSCKQTRPHKCNVMFIVAIFFSFNPN